MSNILKSLLLVGIGVLGTVTVDYTLSHFKFKENPIGNFSLDTKHFLNGSLPYINPLLDCEIATVDISSSLYPFQSILEKEVKSIISSGSVSDVSIYFRDLNNGPWFGINIEEKYIPASLLKLPTAIAYYKAVETDPSFSKRKIIFDLPDQDLTSLVQIIKPRENLVLGEAYEIENLIERMLVYSDNQATNLMFENLGSKAILDVFKNLGVKYDLKSSVDFEISVREFATFFRILYNSSYLNKENSNKILKTLTDSNFKEGIAKPVISDSIVISHKFGETSTSPGKFQLHDCGIIYYPNHPYVLCVFTKGNNFDTLITTLQKISSIVLKEVRRQNSL